MGEKGKYLETQLKLLNKRKSECADFVICKRFEVSCHPEEMSQLFHKDYINGYPSLIFGWILM